MMIYKGNLSYYYAYLRNSINYILMGFSIVHEFTYRVDSSPFVTTFFADRVR